MTAAAVEVGQAEASEPDSREQHLAELAKATAAVDRWSAQLIIDELAELMPGLDRAEEQAAGRLREACTALEGPERRVADLEEHIARADSELASWRSQFDTGDVAARVTARQWISEWENERTALVQRKEFVQAEMAPLIDARSKARADLELVAAAKRGLAWAMVDPFGSAAGQATQAYIGYRQTRLAYVLLCADPGHPEWDTACAELRELCISAMRGGYDVARDLPDFGAVAFRAMVSEMASADSTPPAPAPGMIDVMALTKAEFENNALQGHPTSIERRDLPPPGARPVPERGFMRWDSPLRDTPGG